MRREFPLGTLLVAGRRGSTEVLLAQGDKALDVHVERSNAPDNRAQFFFNPDVARLAHLDRVGNQRRIPSTSASLASLTEAKGSDEQYLLAVKNPTSPYSPGGLMLIAGRVSDIVRPAEEQRTQLIYDEDFPAEIQAAYWGTAMGVLDRFMDLKANNHPSVAAFSDGVIPAIMGAHSRDVRGDRPSIRSVKFPHDHIVFIDPAHMTSLEQELPEWNLSREDRHFSRGFLGSRNLNEFVEALNRKQGTNQFTVHEGRPFGYQVEIPFGEQHGKDVATILSSHFKNFSEIATQEEAFIKAKLLDYPELAEKIHANTVVQPSFAFYLIPDPKRRGFGRAIFVPTIVPNWGAPEKAGIDQKVDPDYEAKISASDTAMLHRVLVG
ncbi:MAG: hypothetical protein AAB553_00990 [Patescibacteria group bacterium]